MKKWFNKIDPLIVFFLLSLITLFSFVGDVDYFLPKSKISTFKNYVDSKYVFGYPKQGLLNKNETIKLYSPNYKLLISVNGGKTYTEYYNQSVLDLKSENIKNNVTSIRFKNPFGKMPEICSFLIKAVHINGSQFTKPIQLTYYTSYVSNLPIVNIVVNENDLFDNKKGILILGEQSWYDDDFYKEFWYRNANYNQRGEEWLKESYFQVFIDDSLSLESRSVIQVSGHASRTFSQKSLKIKTDKRYSKDKIKNKLFQDSKIKKYSSLVLRNSGNDNKKTLFADLLMHNLAKNTKVITQSGQTVNVFINGNYWGIYNLRERQSKNYIAKNEKVKPLEITVLEKGNGRLKVGSNKERIKYIYLIDSLSKLNKITNADIEFINEKISLKSFTDYIVLETFYGNYDWLNNNTLWYRAKSKKWKWILVDLDVCLAFNTSNLQTNYFDKLRNSNSITAKLFKLLMLNDTYKKQFKLRVKTIVENDFSEKNIYFEYNSLKSKIEPDINQHINRWRGNFTESEWEDNCNNNLDFLLNRRQIFLNQVDKL